MDEMESDYEKKLWKTQFAKISGLFASNRVQSRVIQLFPLSSGMVSNESFGRKVYFVQPL